MLCFSNTFWVELWCSEEATSVSRLRSGRWQELTHWQPASLGSAPSDSQQIIKPSFRLPGQNGKILEIYKKENEFFPSSMEAAAWMTASSCRFNTGRVLIYYLTIFQIPGHDLVSLIFFVLIDFFYKKRFFYWNLY